MQVSRSVVSMPDYREDYRNFVVTSCDWSFTTLEMDISEPLDVSGYASVTGDVLTLRLSDEFPDGVDPINRGNCHVQIGRIDIVSAT